MTALLTASRIEIAGLTKRFGGRRALDSAWISAEGRSVAVLGPNGAGKTVLLRCLATVMRPTEGTVRIDGLDPMREAERIEIRRRLGYAPQHASFEPDLRVVDAIDTIACMKGHDDERRRRAAVHAALDQVGLSDRAADRIGELSGGMQRRAVLAQALLGRPTLLVLDEPAAGADADERVRLRSVLRGGPTRTVVVATHHVDDAADCDLTAVLQAGRLAFFGTPAALADRAAGLVWEQTDLPPPGVRASWPVPGGGFRCLGTPPPGVATVAPTVEEGYLTVTRAT